MNHEASLGDKCLIVCGGNLPTPYLIDHLRCRNQSAICTDGVATQVVKLLPDFNFDIVIGDFDSHQTPFSVGNASDDFDEPRYIKASDQDMTDSEKAIRFALNNGTKDIDLIGFQGGRLDHTLNNLSLLKKYHKHADIRFWDNTEVTICRSSDFTLTLNKGTRISFMPLFGSATFGICTGLKYPIDGMHMEIGHELSVSNETDDEIVKIQITQGSIMTLYEHTVKML